MKASIFARQIIFAVYCMIVIMSTSCVKDNDPEQGVEQFAGLWSGTYSGNVDRGTWEVTIREDGIISGTATSTPMDQTYGVNGTVSDDGAFRATAGSATTGTTFTGSLTRISGEGTWENTTSGLNGTWSGTKQNTGAGNF